MQREISNSPAVELDKQTPEYEGVSFDDENARLEGYYRDELSAYRARRVWQKTLADYFLLEDAQDYDLKIISLFEKCRFQLRCDFRTACARYAFWRLINSQTPEAQYIIETAHIPQCESRQHDFLTACDLYPRGHKAPLIVRDTTGITASRLSRLFSSIKIRYRRLLNKL